MKPSPEQKANLLKRLARVEGQLRGVQKLISDDAECDKVLQQMAASRKALDRACIDMIACLIESSVLHQEDKKSSPKMAQNMVRIRELLLTYF